MQMGVNLPNFGPYADPVAMAGLARSAEEAGWDGFFVWDHILVGDGVSVGDPWVILAAAATLTERITLGTMVTPLPRRRPWVVARQAVSLDHLSGGRFVLGVGIGFPPDIEFGSFFEPVDERVRADMLDEGLEILAGMWSGEPFGFEGRHYRVAPHRFLPRPVGATGIPVWVAGMWPHRRPFRRAARWDGVFPIATDLHTLSPAEVAEIVVLVGANREEGSRFEVVVGGPPLEAGELAAYAAVGVTWYLIGPAPEGETVEETATWVAAGPPA
jgi:alkanesulfonate monooxygenase SsuD/methylene tetrahydromethanopterin reductase-like flavin-dependent oxidoreductase (luciferase family)